jgi:hypothetical protein
MGAAVKSGGAGLGKRMGGMFKMMGVMAKARHTVDRDGRGDPIARVRKSLDKQAGERDRIEAEVDAEIRGALDRALAGGEVARD